jgi:hypothetical protein
MVILSDTVFVVAEIIASLVNVVLLRVISAPPIYLKAGIADAM